MQRFVTNNTNLVTNNTNLINSITRNTKNI